MPVRAWPFVASVYRVQTPSTQPRRPPQARPQAPQLFLSVARFTHCDPHAVVPVGHEVTHRPVPQTVPVGHTVPHAPQFVGSLAVSVQLDPQSVRPSGHTQIDALHTRPPLQPRPQVPQLFGSVRRSTQSTPHATSPDAQLVVHALD